MNSLSALSLKSFSFLKQKMAAFKCKLEKYTRTCSEKGLFSVYFYYYFAVGEQVARSQLLIKIQILSSLNLFLPSETSESARERTLSAH